MKNLTCLLLVFLFAASCVKDRKTTWDTEMLAPIVKSKLMVSDLLKSDYIITNPDSSLKLVYSSDLFSVNTDSFVEIPDSTFEVGASLQTLELPSDTIEYRITMGEIAQSVGGFLGPFILANHGGTINNVFGETETQVDGRIIDISMSDLFDELILDSGIAEIVLINETPFEIKNVNFELSNKPQPGGAQLIDHFFTLIPAEAQTSESFILTDDTVKSELEAFLDQITVAIPGGSIEVDTNEAIVAQVIVRNLKPRQATAIWPDQNVIDETRVIPFGNNVDVDFKDASIREGEIYFQIHSSLEDSIYLTYEVSNVVHPITGLSFKIDTILPPAPPNGLSTLSKTYPLNGYHFDFNGNGYLTPGDDAFALSDDTINTYVTHLTAKIQYTGLKKTLSIDDTVFVQAQVKDLKPAFARGYLRNKKVNAGPSSINFNLFNKIKSGEINLEDVNFEIEIDNGIGASAEARFTRISGINNNNSNRVDLSFNSGNELMQINAASYNGENNRTTHSHSTKLLTTTNSNIDAFVENFPNILEYDLEVELNYGESQPAISEILDPDNPPNFIHYEDDIRASFNMEIPLSLIADTLVLVDTLDFNLTNETGNEVESGKFKLLVDNGFPLDAITSIYFLDDTELIVDSLWSNKTIARGQVNGTGQVSSSTRTVINFEIPKEKMDVIKLATKIYVVAGFHTFDLLNPSQEFYKIYNHYSFDVKLVGDFTYQFSN
ncbi:MAG: hypothetical protein CMP67_01585 [Flavobacteriales bacterium]|nr:hypothetical protein [Flavobacteriales bacterium]MBO72278.1 hypothetical protein [Flavobacteriales bacterium]